MPTETGIIILEKLSKSLSNLKVDNDLAYTNKTIGALIRDLQSCEWSIQSSKKLDDIIKEYQKGLNSFYNNNFRIFDEADSLYAFDIKYDIRRSIRNQDYTFLETLIILYILQTQKGYDEGHIRLAKMNVCNTVGRFLVLFNGSFDIPTDSSLVTHPFYKVAQLTLECLTLYQWNLEESIYLKLCVLNILDVVGSAHRESINKIWEGICDKTKTENESSSDLTINTINKTINLFFESLKTGKQIESLETTWLHAYIYKQRFGYLYCKKIKKTNTSSYFPYTFVATGLCFKDLKERIIGNSPKVVLLEKGVVKRSSEYQPLEASFLFNFTSMKFE